MHINFEEVVQSMSFDFLEIFRDWCNIEKNRILKFSASGTHLVPRGALLKFLSNFSKMKKWSNMWHARSNYQKTLACRPTSFGWVWDKGWVVPKKPKLIPKVKVIPRSRSSKSGKFQHFGVICACAMPWIWSIYVNWAIGWQNELKHKVWAKDDRN